VAQDAGGVTGAGTSSVTDDQGVQSRTEDRVNPYYSLLRLPDETKQEFVIFRSFVPFSPDDQRKELQAFMVGVSELGDANYGRLVSYEVRNVGERTQAPGPGLVASTISSQEQISERITLLNANADEGGSSVEFGDLIVLPIDSDSPSDADDADAEAAMSVAQGSLLYVRPLYVLAAGTELPQLEWIIVSHADSVVMCHTLADSVRALFGVEIRGLDAAETARTDEEVCVGDVAFNSVASPVTNAGDDIVIAEGPAAEQALDLLQQADRALIDGNLGLYQQLVERARDVLTDFAAEAGSEDAESEDADAEADDAESDEDGG